MDRQRQAITTHHDATRANLGVARPAPRRRTPGRRGMRAGSAFALLALAAATDATAATVFVANTGSDGPACGTASAPCRTISQGVVVAAAGDRVLVLPGVYGDVDGDGEFVSPGDEPARYDDGCNCLVNVDKPVSILSQSGAGATILRGAVDGLFTVDITAPGVVLGKKRNGFTIIGDPQHDGYGVRAGDAARGTRIEGNSFSRLETAIIIAGSGSQVIGNRISQVLGQGIHAEGEGIRVAKNVVEQTGALGGNDSAINVVGRSGAGHVVEGNLVVGNFGLGIFVDNGSSMAVGEPHVIQNNLVVGNGKAGIKVVLAANGRGATVTGNSIYNNDGEGGTNCGLMTLSAGPAIDATGNYWGGAGGPGPNPKDDVCSVGTPPDTGAPASAEFAVVAPAMR